MNSVLPQAPRLSLVDSAISVIRRQIESGEWRVGERIPKEQELAEMLQVGRNTVREAIRVLSHAQVLEVRQGDGTYLLTSLDPTEVMRRISRSSLREHLELRLMLETEAARLAAQNRTENDVIKLRQLLTVRTQTELSQYKEAFADADTDFHVAVVAMGGNTALTELYRYFSHSVRQNSLSVINDTNLQIPDLKAHSAIVDAIERQDRDAAAAAVEAVVKPLLNALRNTKFDNWADPCREAQYTTTY
ncbi:FCD domain-containing protein [Pseudomonas sp. CFSAN084952]|uniref:FadR/GntR family transcriptional regulator n=1 Tax=Pseudomonas TaxID=286 RepID=UPI00129997C0|nr:FadR/GntR family transcriptional regulator [Pseudomonas sp. CFSAN084952]QGF91718.1 FCD domain-containing protein [Pseudomonas sp. CFSAN084952]